MLGRYFYTQNPLKGGDKLTIRVIHKFYDKNSDLNDIIKES